MNRIFPRLLQFIGLTKKKPSTAGDWLNSENFEEILFHHLGKTRKRTGRERPESYEELLTIQDEDEFIAWLFILSGGEYQENTLQEMIEHESTIGNYLAQMRDDDPDTTKVLYYLFDKERSAEAFKALKGIIDISDKYGYEGDDDIFHEALFAKGLHDYHEDGENV